MNTLIINKIIAINNEYENSLKDFPDKNNISKLYFFEIENYKNRITKEIIPLIYNETKSNIEERYDFYFAYIKVKYHKDLIKEIQTYHKNDQFKIMNQSKIMIQDFNKQLISLREKSEEIKIDYISTYYRNNIKFIEDFLEEGLFPFIKMVCEYRNVKLQYKIIHNEKIEKKLNELVNQLNKKDFDLFIEKYTIYPLDVELDDYYNKWIGYEKLHIKFLNKIINNAKYDYAKLYIKMKKNGKKPKVDISIFE